MRQNFEILAHLRCEYQKYIKATSGRIFRKVFQIKIPPTKLNRLAKNLAMASDSDNICPGYSESSNTGTVPHVNSVENWNNQR